MLIAVCDGLKGLAEAITTTWEHTVVQQCIVHLIRNSFRYAGRQHGDAIVKALRPVYAAPSEQAAKERFGEFADQWGERYPAIVRLWGELRGRVAAALKCLYLVTRSLDLTGGGRARWVIRWKPALNAFAITFAGPVREDHPLNPPDPAHRLADNPKSAICPV